MEEVNSKELICRNFLLELDEEGNVANIQADELLRIPNNSNLKIKFFNGSKISKNVKLITNAYTMQVSKNVLDFLKNNFTNPEKKIDSLNLISGFDKIFFTPYEINDCVNFHIELKKSGPIFITFAYEENSKIKFTNEIYIIVEPTIEIGTKKIGLDSMQQQTILSKSLGKIDEWEFYFKEAEALKYNFVHFTPIQSLGRSESLYCIRDNNEINDDFFKTKLSNEQKLKMIHTKICEFREKYGIASMVDIVLNHTASNSEWLRENPQSGFNLENSPHLCCAYEIDKLLLNYSYRFADRKVTARCAPYINNENDLNELMTEVSQEIYKLNFEEFFLIGIERYYEEFRIFYQKMRKNIKEFVSKKNFLLEQLRTQGGIAINTQHNLDNLIFDLIFEGCTLHGASRYGVELNVEFVSLLVMHYLNEDNNKTANENGFIQEVKRYLNRANDFWYKKSKEFIAKAIENVRAYIKYEFLDLKRFKVTYWKRIVENYFTVFDENKKASIFANNGWLFGVSDPTVNFAKYGNWHYFTRSVVIWGDCPKLNYGDKPEDSPYLWSHMTQYVQDMARIFNGFRLDNAHSTPIYVAEYLMSKAREINPNLVIIAELFAGTKEREINFVNRIGINHLIREAIYCNDPANLSEKTHKFGGGFDYVLGKLDTKVQEYESYKGKIFCKESYSLLPSHPRSIIYDLTHDNPTYYEKYNNLGLNLTFLAVVSMSQASIGTTRGFDQLFPYQPSVVKENRLYDYRDPEFYSLVDNEDSLLPAMPSEKNEKVEKSGNGKLTTREHTFELNLKNQQHPKTLNVRLALSSRGWKPDIILPKIGDKVYSITLQLNIGEVYYYKYVLDNNIWIHDNSKENIMDNSGNINNILDLREESKFMYNLTDLKLVRREINNIRNSLDKYDETKLQFYLHRDRDLICIFRMFSDISSDFAGYAMITRCGYENNKANMLQARVELPGEIHEFLFSAIIHIPGFDINLIRSEPLLSGVKGKLQFTRDIKFLQSVAKINNINGKTIIEFHSLPPNTVIFLKIKHSSLVKEAITTLTKSLEYISQDQAPSILIDGFDMCDINSSLYKCETEELDNTNKKRGNYEIRDYGKFVYAGLANVHGLIQKLKKSQNLDHAMFLNIREGDWLIEYKLNRLSEFKTLEKLFVFLKDNIISHYKNLSTYLKPYFFSLIIDCLYSLISRKVFSQSSNPALLNGEFSSNLLLGVLQFTGYVKSATFRTGDRLSVAAGLPHFATEYMRCWGRDTFISLRGLLLIPGYLQSAKQVIRNFASTLRHGLIPNLLDSGNKPRYNSRDSVWFFLQSITDYIKITDDKEFLNEEIKMFFLDDDMNKHFSKLNRGDEKIMKLKEIIHTILESHARGIEFKEWRAGKEIDEHMKDEGFNIKIYMDRCTGFIYGGNASNCGTWMDKMGSSDKARSKGVPATPRDGADVEIIGILYSVLNFFSNLNNLFPHVYPFKSIKLKDDSTFSYYEWSLLIKDNFESNFFVTSSLNDTLVNKRNIYKDYISHPGNNNNRFANYQLRPNFLIAMAVSPELFTKENALKALDLAEKYLLVPNGMGVRTLDPEDKQYNGNYNNSDDSYNFSSAHGFNYHNVTNLLKINFLNIKILISFT
jgi:glycogen debranching enzyme